jgi:hypothetical protein
MIAQVSKRVRRVRAQLEMDLEGRAPEGVLTSTEGRSIRFSGWTELAAAIEAWRSDARSARPGDNGAAEAPQEEQERSGPCAGDDGGERPLAKPDVGNASCEPGAGVRRWKGAS